MGTIIRQLRHGLPKILVLASLGLLLSGGVAQATTDPPPSENCAQGEFCSWSEYSYLGHKETLDLRTANPGDCIPLNGLEAQSFINRMRHDVTVYQGADCSTEGDFTTYPGHGTYVPQAHFIVRAIQIWA